MLEICISFFFFNDTATTEIYTLSLHDALPISTRPTPASPRAAPAAPARSRSSTARCAGRWSSTASTTARVSRTTPRSEEHTSELQSRQYLVCRLLLEKKKKTHNLNTLNQYITM